MPFIHVNAETEKRINDKVYSLERTAKSALTKLEKRYAKRKMKMPAIKVMDLEKYTFLNQGRMKTVRSLMTGAEIVIAEDTPRSCDPSSETYWSM